MTEIFLGGLIEGRRRGRPAEARLKAIVEAPDQVLDRIIRSVRQSGGTISGKLRAEYPILDLPEIANEVEHAIREAFPPSEAPLPSPS